MSCWRKATKEEIWKDIEKQKCLICSDTGTLADNEEAWIKFRKVYDPLIWSKVKEHTPESNQEDVIQDIYVKLWEYGMRSWCMNPCESFSSYLSRVIWSAIIDDLKRKYFLAKSKEPLSSEESEDLESRRKEILMAPEDMKKLGEAKIDDVEQKIIDEISMEELREALLRFLSREERNVLWLHNAEKYTIKETAEKLGKSEEKIKTIHKRASRKLRKKLKKEDYFGKK